jgi:hypothetical protein
MGLKWQLRRLRRDVQKDVVLIKLEDGSTRVFDDMECWKDMFLAQYHLFMSEAYDSEVLTAVRNAAPESRRAFEEDYGEITMEAQIICPVADGGWVDVYTLTEAGTVEKVHHEGDSKEAEMLRLAAQGNPPPNISEQGG